MCIATMHAPTTPHPPTPPQACRFAGGGASTQRHTRARPPAPEGLYIVRFREYAMAEAHHTALQTALTGGSSSGDSGGWEWVERRNPAAAHPTDFGLLRLAPAGEAALKVRAGYCRAACSCS